jgi:hypothetical protein
MRPWWQQGGSTVLRVDGLPLCERLDGYSTQAFPSFQFVVDAGENNALWCGIVPQCFHMAFSPRSPKTCEKTENLKTVASLVCSGNWYNARCSRGEPREGNTGPRGVFRQGGSPVIVPRFFGAVVLFPSLSPGDSGIAASYLNNLPAAKHSECHYACMRCSSLLLDLTAVSASLQYFSRQNSLTS